MCSTFPYSSDQAYTDKVLEACKLASQQRREGGGAAGHMDSGPVDASNMVDDGPPAVVNGKVVRKVRMSQQGGPTGRCIMACPVVTTWQHRSERDSLHRLIRLDGPPVVCWYYPVATL